MFKLHSDYVPMGDQPKAIEELSNNLINGAKKQTLLGATGTGKTYTIANVIKNYGRKTLVLAHNKTLAGQLYAELKSFFPENRVEYFISYYDYYQPEAYVAAKDLYIEKDCDINDEIDQMRHSAVASLLTEDDVIVVASVSCIYGIGDPEDYKKNMLPLKVGMEIEKHDLIEKLIIMQYKNNPYELQRGTFRFIGDTLDLMLSGEREEIIRIDFDYDEIAKIKIIDAVNSNTIRVLDRIIITPATLFALDQEKLEEGIRRIREELEQREKYFLDNHKPLEQERIHQRTIYDLEMLSEVGTCSGVENYSRHLSLRAEGETPYTLMDFFGDDYLLIVDESHVTLPQVRGMYNGDRARKESLVEYGFRLPSALDNRPLKYEEFEQKISKVIYVSATPTEVEKSSSFAVVEQIIRPTGLLDPIVEVRGSKGQIDNLLVEIQERIKRNERTLVLTLTKKMSESLTDYLKDAGIKVGYLHSEIKSLERMEIIRSLRKKEIDCLVGINLLREGLDIPEVSLIAILDADKEGFLRSETSLIQIIGRAARNSNGKVIMYADNITNSMKNAMMETFRRRSIQEQYNKEHGIVPKTIVKSISDDFAPLVKKQEELEVDDLVSMTNLEKKALIAKLEVKMKAHAKALEFEEAMAIRDVIMEIKAAM